MSFQLYGMSYLIFPFIFISACYMTLVYLFHYFHGMFVSINILEYWFARKNWTSYFTLFMSIERSCIYRGAFVSDSKCPLLQKGNLWTEKGSYLKVTWSLLAYDCILVVFMEMISLFLQIIEYANNRGFTSIIVVHTNRREPGLHSPINSKKLAFFSYWCL